MTWVWRWAPVLAQMAVIYVASSMTAVPDLPGGLSSYAGHMIGYAMLGALAIRAVARATWVGVTPPAGIRAVLLSSAYGVTDELHQALVPNRFPDVNDWAADTAGALIGVLAVMALARRVGRRHAGTRGV